MSPGTPLPAVQHAALPATLQQRALATWRVLHLGALVLTLGLMPSSYRAPWRRPLARQLLRAAVPLLPWFTLLAAIVSVVVVRIVLVTAESYGLSQLALEMVVRVLVIELIPMTAAFAVAVQVTLPAAAELLQARRRGQLGHPGRGLTLLRAEVAPRVLAGVFCVLLLAALSSVVALVLAYLMAHGLSPWALQGYTRMVGQVFTPAVALVFVLKTGALALAVSVLPIGSALHDRDDAAAGADLPGGPDLRGLVRLFALVLVIEVLSLAGNYL